MNQNYFTDKDVKRLEAQAVQTRTDIIRMIGKAPDEAQMVETLAQISKGGVV
ncbi:MAG: hypothetical protein PUB12_03295 [[Clostridium] aminophilum]|uniref:hypothetical protein n=1 Tax=[Clostridium] aminophilum TaxID=1526 RepID=UPI0026EAB8E2|nr:hypothetical protein [[Clostridium] aminophilum]MDD6195902.1 hypothetical protein [[Clostridium] aminophilum]